MHDIIPNLRVLELEFQGNTVLEETTELAMVASRRPVLRELRITGYSVLSAAAVQALGAGGNPHGGDAFALILDNCTLRKGLSRHKVHLSEKEGMNSIIR
jgi:hypothetical protein